MSNIILTIPAQAFSLQNVKNGFNSTPICAQTSRTLIPVIAEILSLKTSFYLKRLQYFMIKLAPPDIRVNVAMLLRACFGAMFGLFCTAWLSSQLFWHSNGIPPLIAPMGATAVLIFTLPSSPLAQPWGVVFGNTISAAIGFAFAYYLGVSLFSISAAVGVSLLLMFVSRSLHPPGGAIALLVLLSNDTTTQLSLQIILAGVFMHSVLIVLCAVIYHRLFHQQYPHIQKTKNNSHGTGDQPIQARIGLRDQDIQAVMASHGELLDISRSDLEVLFTQFEIRIAQRQYDEVLCSDVMSRNIVSVGFETPLETCWQLLRTHKIKALPVVDEQRHVIGILTVIDFLKSANLDVYHDFDLKLRQLMDTARHWSGGQFQVAGHIMTSQVRTASADSTILNLVDALSDGGLHHIPIIDAQSQLCGMITQSDLVAALYRMRMRMDTTS